LQHTVIDIEASGFGRDSYPIEVGVVLPDGKAHCYLIKPPTPWTHWDPAAEQVHGISRELLLDNGMEPLQIAQSLNDLLLGVMVYTDAWSHDLSWLGKLYAMTETTQLFKLESLRSLLSEQQSARWHQTKEKVIAEFNLKRHRASTDARVIQETLGRVLHENGQNPDIV
jgi:hypothetical protein